ncbi:MAG: competence protein ComFA [Clostridia bacterium]|nr:competence protein ComFA [Clostridia bacterium]
MNKVKGYPQSFFCWMGYVYLVYGKNSGHLGISHKPGLDFTFWVRQGYKNFKLLTPALPIGTAAFFRDLFLKSNLDREGNNKQLINKIMTIGRRLLGLTSWEPTKGALVEPLMPPPIDEIELIKEIMEGRIFWREELIQSMIENKIKVRTPLEDILHWLHLKGDILLFPGVGYDANGKPCCKRCGQSTKLIKVKCAACQSEDFVCEECLNMGQSRLCRPLYARQKSEKIAKRDYEVKCNPKLEFDLSLAQKDAYDKAKDFVAKGKAKECLLWAVCGAGKTEVAYGAITTVLERGGKVLYTCPRREVIRELYLRLRSVWPQLSIKAVYGGSTDKYSQADLILATTHQTLRFYRMFDLVILDEVDAFPLAGNPMLYHVVERARHQSGQVLWLTATPPTNLIERVNRRELEVIYLPARHHGYPLPEPKIITDPFLKWFGNKRVLKFLIKCIEVTLKQRVQILVFVSSVMEVKKLVKLLANCNLIQPSWVRGCYANCSRREEIINSFRKGEFPILVTTTVLERGVTIPRLNVLVLYADDERVFDNNTLVQIAGRVGRASTYPQGNVWFIGQRVTHSMASACKQIKNFNQLAYKRGYLLK